MLFALVIGMPLWALIFMWRLRSRLNPATFRPYARYRERGRTVDSEDGDARSPLSYPSSHSSSHPRDPLSDRSRMSSSVSDLGSVVDDGNPDLTRWTAGGRATSVNTRELIMSFEPGHINMNDPVLRSSPFRSLFRGLKPRVSSPTTRKQPNDQQTPWTLHPRLTDSPTPRLPDPPTPRLPASPRSPTPLTSFLTHRNQPMNSSRGFMRCSTCRVVYASPASRSPL